MHRSIDQRQGDTAHGLPPPMLKWLKCVIVIIFFFFFSHDSCLGRVRLGNTTEAARKCLNAYFYCGSFVGRRPCYEINSVVTEVE